MVWLWLNYIKCLAHQNGNTTFGWKAVVSCHQEIGFMLLTSHYFTKQNTIITYPYIVVKWRSLLGIG